MLSGIPILPVESYEVWAAEDLEEVKATRFELDVESIDNGRKYFIETLLSTTI